jgi:DNA polymerase III subunit delta
MTITLVGENTYLLRKELSKVISDFEQEHGDLAVERFSGEVANFEQIFSAITNPPFLTPKKLVAVEDISSVKDINTRFEELLSQSQDQIEVVLVSDKLDKRSALYKYLKKHTDYKEFANIPANNISGWVKSEVVARGGSIDSQSAQVLVEFVGTNQQKLSNEIDKLLQYNSKISEDSINLLSVKQPSTTMFQLLDALFAKDTKSMMSLYDDQRKQQVEPITILSMVFWQLHILAVVKTAPKGKSSEQIAKDAGIHSFVVQKSVNIARKMSLAHLKKFISDVVDLEVKLKTQTVDADDAVKHLLLDATM